MLRTSFMSPGIGLEFCNQVVVLTLTQQNLFTPTSVVLTLLHHASTKICQSLTSRITGGSEWIERFPLRTSVRDVFKWCRQVRLIRIQIESRESVKGHGAKIGTSETQCARIYSLVRLSPCMWVNPRQAGRGNGFGSGVRRIRIHTR